MPSRQLPCLLPRALQTQRPALLLLLLAFWCVYAAWMMLAASFNRKPTAPGCTTHACSLTNPPVPLAMLTKWRALFGYACVSRLATMPSGQLRQGDGVRPKVVFGTPKLSLSQFLALHVAEMVSKYKPCPGRMSADARCWGGRQTQKRCVSGRTAALNDLQSLSCSLP